MTHHTAKQRSNTSNKVGACTGRDGPGSGAVQHGDGSAGAPPRGVAISARIERAGVRRGAVSEAQQQHKPNWSTRRATGARGAVRRAWRLPARHRVRDGDPEGAIGCERVEELVEFGRGRDMLREQRLPWRRRALRRRDGRRRRRFGARYRRRRAERDVQAAVQRAPQHESWLVEWRGSAERRTAARRRVVHPAACVI